MKLFLLIVLFVPLASLGQDYKCVENGKVVYTNIPCSKPTPKQPVEIEKTAAQIQAEFEQEKVDRKAAEETKRADLAKEVENQKIIDLLRKKAIADGPQRAALGAQIIRGSMRDPDSFKLTTAQVVDDTGSVCYTYRSKNGFGGYVSGLAIFPAMHPSIIMSGTSGFNELWDKECFMKKGTFMQAAIQMFAL